MYRGQFRVPPHSWYTPALLKGIEVTELPCYQVGAVVSHYQQRFLYVSIQHADVLSRSLEPGPLLTFCPDGHQLDSLAGDEVQGFVYIVDFVHSHLPPLWFRQPLP